MKMRCRRHRSGTCTTGNDFQQTERHTTFGTIRSLCPCQNDPPARRRLSPAQMAVAQELPLTAGKLVVAAMALADVVMAEVAAWAAVMMAAEEQAKGEGAAMALGRATAAASEASQAARVVKRVAEDGQERVAIWAMAEALVGAMHGRRRGRPSCTRLPAG